MGSIIECMLNSLSIQENQDGPCVAVCRPLVHAPDTPPIWSVWNVSAQLDSPALDAWNRDRHLCQTVVVSELRAFTWHLGPGDFSGVHVDLLALDMLLEWLDVETLEWLVWKEDGEPLGLLLFDGRRLAGHAHTTWSVSSETGRCPHCRELPTVETNWIVSSLSDDYRVENVGLVTEETRHPTLTRYRVICSCGVSGTRCESHEDAVNAWNRLVGVSTCPPTLRKWNKYNERRDDQPVFGHTAPAFGPPPTLLWFDDEGNGPSILRVVLTGMDYDPERLEPSVHLRVPVLDGAGAMELDEARKLRDMAQSAVEWLENRVEKQSRR